MNEEIKEFMNELSGAKVNEVYIDDGASKETMLKSIYEMVANKHRRFWCKYIIKNKEGKEFEVRETEGECIDFTDWDDYRTEYWYDETRTYYLVSVIWHPVRLWDVLARVKDWTIGGRYTVDKVAKELVKLREELDEPIERQDEECIEYVYHLLFV